MSCGLQVAEIRFEHKYSDLPLGIFYSFTIMWMFLTSYISLFQFSKQNNNFTKNKDNIIANGSKNQLLELKLLEHKTG